MSKEDIFAKLKESIVEMDSDLAEEAAKEALEAGLDPLECIGVGLSDGMAVMSDMFDEGEAFVPDLMMASEAFEMAVAILTSNLSDEEKSKASSGKVLIHTVQGDIHDIGKNIVKTMFAANNFEVFDLGARRTGADGCGKGGGIWRGHHLRQRFDDDDHGLPA